MARAVEIAKPDWPLEGLVVTRYGHSVPCERIHVAEAAHPVPDSAGVDAANRLLKLAESATADDLVVFLISGGASALLSLPGPGVTLQDKQATTKALLAAGADIAEINTVRRHLSGIKGGKLARAVAPARLLTLAISDVIGDDPAVIGSGPTVPDPTRLADARAVLERYSLTLPPAIRRCLQDDAFETAKPGDPAFDKTQYEMIATPMQSLEAALASAKAAGIDGEVISDRLDGEARTLGRDHAQMVQAGGRLSDIAPPFVSLSGGETTVTITGSGKGGPNTEYLIALAIALRGHPCVWAMACDTDGADGSEDNAGAIIGPDTLARAEALGLRPEDYLADNNAWSFFDALGDLVVTGPTMTNVNDFRAILIA